MILIWKKTFKQPNMSYILIVKHNQDYDYSDPKNFVNINIVKNNEIEIERSFFNTIDNHSHMSTILFACKLEENKVVIPAGLRHPRNPKYFVDRQILRLWERKYNETIITEDIKKQFADFAIKYRKNRFDLMMKLDM